MLFALLATFFIPLVKPDVARAAKNTDGTWTQSGAPGTTTITFTTTTGVVSGDKIVLTFPSQADVNAAGTNITVTGSTTPTRANNDTNNTVTITTDGAVTASNPVTITMSDGLTSYTTTTFAQQSVAINHNTTADVAKDYGVALITNDNTTDVTANVPLFVTMAVDDTTMNLGTLSVSAVNTDDQIYTVNSNNATGIQMQIDGTATGLASGGNDINDVADGTVTAGSEEYGISNAVSGLTAESPFDSGDDAVPNSPTDIADTTAAVSNGTLTVTYKASISGTTAAGTYTETPVTMTIATKA